MKKIQKKARQENKNKDGDSGDDRKPKLKEEDSSKFMRKFFRIIFIFKLATGSLIRFLKVLTSLNRVFAKVS